MPNTRERTYEVKVEETWRPATLAEAHALYRMSPKRCPACHGQVMVSGTYTSANRFKLQHRQAHPGCPFATTYTGTPSPHPQALT